MSQAENNPEFVQFSRGPSSRLPDDKTPGMFLLETDTGTMYCDDTEENRIQVKDPTKLPLTGGEITGNLSVSQSVTAQTFVGDLEGNATNADNLGNLPVNDFIRHLGMIDDVSFLNRIQDYSYEAWISATTAESLGLPSKVHIFRSFKIKPEDTTSGGASEEGGTTHNFQLAISEYGTIMSRLSVRGTMTGWGSWHYTNSDDEISDDYIESLFEGVNTGSGGSSSDSGSVSSSVSKAYVDTQDSKVLTAALARIEGTDSASQQDGNTITDSDIENIF